VWQRKFLGRKEIENQARLKIKEKDRLPMGGPGFLELLEMDKL
jgi:hypothetical protein